MTNLQLLSAALLASGVALLLVAARRARALVRLSHVTPHARDWRVVAGLTPLLVVGYLLTLGATLVDHASLLGAVTGAVSLFGAGFVLFVVRASQRTLHALRDTNLARRQLDQTLDALGDAVILVDDDGVVRLANRRFSELVGRRVEEILGRPAAEVAGLQIPPVPLPGASGPASRLQRELRGPGALARPVSLAVTRTNEPFGVVCALTDVREQHQLLARLDAAVAAAERLLRGRHEFMALVALELREPLRAIEAARRPPEGAASPAEFAALGAKVTAACDGLARAVEGLVEVAQRGGSVEGARGFAPSRLMAAVAEEMVAEANRLGVTVSTAIEPAVPVRCFGHETELREIMSLLGIHAMNRAPNGQVCLTIGVVPGDRTEHHLLFSVQDNGPALREGSSELAVDGLQGASLSDRAFDLAICRILVLALGGRLTATNTAGATVTAFFSVQGAPAAPKRLASSLSGLAEGDNPFNDSGLYRPLAEWVAPPIPVDAPRADLPGAVLVVEDNFATRRLLAAQLCLAGHTVATVGTLREALLHIDREQVDVVLLDMMLPDGTGLDLLAALHQRGALERLSVLILSMLAETTSITACFEAGAEDYLPKSVSPVVLRARLAACIEKQRLRARSRQQLSLLAVESQRANDLLRILLPGAIADELQATGSITPRRHERVAVMFADIVGFTAYCDRHPPEEVLASLQGLFTSFETLALENRVQKIKTVGDSFMGAAGLLVADERPALRCVALARAMLAAMREHPTGWKLRIGIHVGPVVDGVAGTRQFLYDIWGDTVNTAQRVEAAGRADVICVSDAVRAQIEPDYPVRDLGTVEIKGKGEIHLFEVLHRVGVMP